MLGSSHVDRDDASRPPPPQWLLWLWWLALVALWIALSLAGAVLWVLFAPWRAFRWLMDRRHRDPH